MINNIPQLKKDRIFSAQLRDSNFTFHTTWGLFSPEHVDEGSKLLIENLDIGESDTTIDLGCGYGPIGLSIARTSPRGKVHMIDKDFVAIEYSKKNAEINRVTNCEIYLSNGFEQVSIEKVDNIVSNLPAKINKEYFWILIDDAKKKLKPGGKMYVVVISGLKEFIKRNFTDFFGNYKKLGQNKTYSVYMATKNL